MPRRELLKYHWCDVRDYYPMEDKITDLQVCPWFRSDIGLGKRIAQGLGIDTIAVMPQKHQ
ncbi:hypothetical protein VB264_20705 [Arcicella aquatica]|uniref:Uncharacterized protein n=1 Tax=Arcicella aquatica TaxID=217141 RepID=A0ABU5QT13_9BACT|nr:hypothetical protein [Arcicella aquatica]MEA5260231.1 hypothetical protein [Arcicella aquatica]